MKLEIAAKSPFSLHAVIHSHGWLRLAPFNLDEETGEFSYIFALDKRVLKLIRGWLRAGVLDDGEWIEPNGLVVNWPLVL